MSLPLLMLMTLSLDGPSSAPELGRVRFERSVARGLELAQSSSKPVFLLFQEIPG